MANYLAMDLVHNVLALHKLGWSDRRIARELGIHRETVARQVRMHEASSNPATNLPTGSGGQSEPASNQPAGSSCPSKPATNLPIGSAGSGTSSEAASRRDPEVQPGTNGGFIALLPTAAGDNVDIAVAKDRALLGSNLSVATEPYGTGGSDLIGAARLVGGDARSGPASSCEPYRQTILAKMEQGLCAQRIYQDLVSDHGFGSKYDSVKRFVRKLGVSQDPPFRRMECPPGQEAQVDFGAGAPIVDAAGQRRRPHVLRFVLSHSRKGYTEAVFQQRTEDFLACLENAFWHVGGVPRTIVIDNLKAAVKHPDWYDPELNPRILAFCEHYGTVILPTKSYTPRHKGKVERGVDYVQENGLKGRSFTSLQGQNVHLAHWESTVADTRIHGTTRQQVCKVFEEVERPALLPLPAGRFPFFHESRRRVHRDGHVEVAKAYYSVPPEYLGREVWARWDGHLVRVYNQRMEQIAVHAQRQAGQFSTQDAHIDNRKVSAVEKGTDWLMRRVNLIGPHAHRWATAMLLERGVAGVRVLVGLISLIHPWDRDQIEKACEIALTHRAFHLRTIRELIKRESPKQQEFDFLGEHEIIRDLCDYGQVVRSSLRGDDEALEVF